MSGSDRSTGIAPVGQVLAALAAFALCCLIIGVIAYSSGRQSEQQHQQSIAAEQAGSSKHQSRPQDARDHAGVPAFAERLISNPEPEGESEKDQRDLAAQENTAAWAFWVVVLSAGQLVLSGIGLVALLETIKQGRLALSRASEANEISRRVAGAELRPYLFVDRVELVEIEDIPATDEDGEPTEEPGWLSGKVVVYLKNVGKVPARNITVHLKQYMGSDFKGRFWGYRHWTVDTWLCAPGNERRVFGTVHVGQERRRDFDNGLLGYYIRLRFTFEDEAGTQYTERAGFRLSGRDLKTFYLFNKIEVAKAREHARQQELKLEQIAKRRRRKPRKKKEPHDTKLI